MPPTPSRTTRQLVPTAATHRLRILVAVCSAVFALGSAVHNFAVVDHELVASMMRAAHTADPEGSAESFVAGFRIVGVLYILGNALGLLALRSRSGALWWLVLAVNATQALGPFAIPRTMWSTAVEQHGVWGVLPSAVTDGGALLLTLVLLGTLVRYRTPWAQARLPEGTSRAEEP